MALAMLSVSVEAMPVTGSHAKVVAYKPPAPPRKGPLTANGGKGKNRPLVDEILKDFESGEDADTLVAALKDESPSAVAATDKKEDEEIASIGAAMEEAAMKADKETMAEKMDDATPAESAAKENLEIANEEAAIAETAAKEAAAAAEAGKMDPKAAKAMENELMKVAEEERAAAEAAKEEMDEAEELKAIDGVAAAATLVPMPKMAAKAKSLSSMLVKLRGRLGSVAKMGRELGERAALLKAEARARVVATEAQLIKEKELLGMADILVKKFSSTMAQAAAPLAAESTKYKGKY